MANKSGQTFELPKRSSMIAELISTQEERDEATREKVMDVLSLSIRTSRTVSREQ